MSRIKLTNILKEAKGNIQDLIDAGRDYAQDIADAIVRLDVKHYEFTDDDRVDIEDDRNPFRSSDEAIIDILEDNFDTAYDLILAYDDMEETIYGYDGNRFYKYRIDEFDDGYLFDDKYHARDFIFKAIREGQETDNQVLTEAWDDGADWEDARSILDHIADARLNYYELTDDDEKQIADYVDEAVDEDLMDDEVIDGILRYLTTKMKPYGENTFTLIPSPFSYDDELHMFFGDGSYYTFIPGYDSVWSLDQEEELQKMIDNKYLFKTVGGGLNEISADSTTSDKIDSLIDSIQKDKSSYYELTDKQLSDLEYVLEGIKKGLYPDYLFEKAIRKFLPVDSYTIMPDPSYFTEYMTSEGDFPSSVPDWEYHDKFLYRNLPDAEARDLENLKRVGSRPWTQKEALRETITESVGTDEFLDEIVKYPLHYVPVPQYIIDDLNEKVFMYDKDAFGEIEDETYQEISEYLDKLVKKYGFDAVAPEGGAETEEGFFTVLDYEDTDLFAPDRYMIVTDYEFVTFPGQGPTDEEVDQMIKAGERVNRMYPLPDPINEDEGDEEEEEEPDWDYIKDYVEDALEDLSDFVNREFETYEPGDIQNIGSDRNQGFTPYYYDGLEQNTSTRATQMIEYYLPTEEADKHVEALANEIQDETFKYAVDQYEGPLKDDLGDRFTGEFLRKMKQKLEDRGRKEEADEIEDVLDEIQDIAWEFEGQDDNNYIHLDNRIVYYDADSRYYTLPTIEIRATLSDNYKDLAQKEVAFGFTTKEEFIQGLKEAVDEITAWWDGSERKKKQSDNQQVTEEEGSATES